MEAERRMEEKQEDGDIFNRESANKIKEEFLELYPRMGELLSCSHFNVFLDILKNEGVALKTDAAVDLFRSMMVNNLTKAFNQMWDLQNITQNLSILEYLKDKYKSRIKPQWRPYGKSVHEQTLPLRVRLLERKGLYLEKQLAFQKDQIEDMIAKVEGMRNYIEEIVRRRVQLSYAIDMRLERFPKLKKEIEHLQLRAIDMAFS